MKVKNNKRGGGGGRAGGLSSCDFWPCLGSSPKGVVYEKHVQWYLQPKQNSCKTNLQYKNQNKCRT